MIRFIMLCATFFGAGYLPIAPGTWGSLAALPLFLLIAHTGLPVYFGVVTGIFVLGVWAAGSAEKILDRSDPGLVVIDEVVGMLITLAMAPSRPLVLLTGFLLFRFFDILKPWPVWLADQRLHGGLGIMLDDVLAGIYGFIVLQGLLRFVPFLQNYP